MHPSVCYCRVSHLCNGSNNDDKCVRVPVRSLSQVAFIVGTTVETPQVASGNRLMFQRDTDTMREPQTSSCLRHATAVSVRGGGGASPAHAVPVMYPDITLASQPASGLPE